VGKAAPLKFAAAEKIAGVEGGGVFGFAFLAAFTGA